MTLLQNIKDTSLIARKARMSGDAALYSTLLGEIESVSKGGKGEVDDAAVVAIIKKFVKNIDLVLTVVDSAKLDYAVALHEKDLLERFLPKQMTDAELKAVVLEIKAGVLATGAELADMGGIMKILKARYEGQYDGKSAAGIIKGVL